MQPLQQAYEWVEWMPSPPLVPDDTPIDLDHLSRATLGERALEREVLALFDRQAADIVTRLEQRAPDSRALIHTLKGSAQGIGAFGVVSAAQQFEAALAEGIFIEDALFAVQRAVTEARGAIYGLLRLP
jgi:HPt (histidine-containing phosphotransfer) domain-containing protein